MPPRQIKTPALAELLMQLRFSPEKQRRKQLDAAERLYEIVEPSRQYPLEFVRFRITGHLPPQPSEPVLIDGQQLLEDLGVFIAKLSGPMAEKVEQQPQRIYTTEQLAHKLGVSTKTIERWRKGGLVARKYLWPDGRKRLGFAQSKIDRFIASHQQLVHQARSFSRLSVQQKRRMIREARRLARTGRIRRHQLIRQLAAKFGCCRETVRSTLLAHERAHPEKPIFHKPAGVITPAQAAEIYRLFRQGTPVPQLMQRFCRSRSSIYRIVKVRRARELLLRKIDFIASDEFLADDARQKILAKPLEQIAPHRPHVAEPFGLADSSLPQYLQSLKQTPPLTRQQEWELFRRYNYLKYLASLRRAGLKPTEVSSARLDEIDSYLDEAERIKKILVEANLPLVVAVARRHLRGRDNLLELISEGNLSLLQAIEKFDYTRGFRFTTFASWTISKDYARKLATHRPVRPHAAESFAQRQQLRSQEPAADFAALEHVRKSLAQVIREELTEREQYVILSRFGPIGQPIKRKTKTLKQIGDELGLSKERIRQIELQALQKLRQSLSAEQFELLTG